MEFLNIPHRPWNEDDLFTLKEKAIFEDKFQNVLNKNVYAKGEIISYTSLDNAFMFHPWFEISTCSVLKEKRV